MSDPLSRETEALLEENRSLRRQLDTAREALRAVVEEYPVAAGKYKSLDGEYEGYGSIFRARRALAVMDGEDKADG